MTIWEAINYGRSNLASRNAFYISSSPPLKHNYLQQNTMATPMDTVPPRYLSLEKVMEMKALAIGGKSMRKAFFQHLQKMRDKVGSLILRRDVWLTLLCSQEVSMGLALDSFVPGWQTSLPGSTFVSVM